MVTNGFPAAPSEKARPTVVAFGTTLPSARLTSVLSMSTHLPFLTACTGSVYSRAV